MCGSEHETGFVSQLNYKYDYDLIKRFILGAKKNGLDRKPKPPCILLRTLKPYILISSKNVYLK